jgi:hypothetical protein
MVTRINKQFKAGVLGFWAALLIEFGIPATVQISDDVLDDMSLMQVKTPAESKYTWD